MKDPLSLTECPLSLLYHSIIFVLLIYTILFTNFLFRVLILLSYFNTPNISILGVRTRKYRMRGILLLFCDLGGGGFMVHLQGRVLGIQEKNKQALFIN